jgi:small subunit ribosomal protein S21
MSFEVEDLRQKGTCVEVHNNDVNKALRKLKKVVQAEGIFQTLRERERFEKPSVKRKKQQARAVKRWQKKLKDYREQGKTTQVR